MQWFQFPETDSTWERESNVTAAELVRKFWESVGVTREEFNGEKIDASPEFIGKLPGIFKFNQLTPSLQFIAECKEFFLRNPTKL